MTTLNSNLGGKTRGEGAYTMEYVESNMGGVRKFYQPIHLYEAWDGGEVDGARFHSYNFFSVLHAVGGPRSVRILTLTKEGKFQIEGVVIGTDEWLIMGPGVWHAGDSPLNDIKSKLLFLYYEHAARRQVSVQEATHSPFAVSGKKWPVYSNIATTDVFPWYLEKQDVKGNIQRYHYENNENEYSMHIELDDELVSADRVAAKVTRFESLDVFGTYLSKHGLLDLIKQATVGDGFSMNW